MFTFASCAKDNKENSDTTQTVSETVSERETEKEDTAVSETTQAEKGYIDIGIIEPTGDYRKRDYNAVTNGINFAKAKKPEIIINGKVYEIRVASSTAVGSMSQAKKAAKMFMDGGVKAVIGCARGEYALGVASVLSEKGIPFIDISNNIARMTDEYSNVISLVSPDYLRGEQIASYAVKKKKCKKLFITCASGDESAQAMAFFCLQKLKALGADGFIQTFDEKNNDFKDIVNTAVGKKCDGVFAAVSSTVAPELINELGKSPITNLFSDVFLQSSEVKSLCKKSGLSLSVCTNINYDSLSDNCRDYMNWMGEDFVRSDKVGGNEYALSYVACDAYNLLTNAMEKTKSTSGKKIVSFIKKGTYKGSFADYSFDKNGVIKNKSFILTVKKDKWQKG